MLVVNAEDGLDEISISSPTRVVELKQGSIVAYTLSPEDFGLSRADPDTLRVETAEQSLEIIRAVLEGQAGPARDIVCLNAGAAIYVAGVCPDLRSGVLLAQQYIDNGKAKKVLDDLVSFSNAV